MTNCVILKLERKNVMPSKGSKIYRYVDKSGSPALRFRLRIVIMIFILVFGACFLIYMMNVNVEDNNRVFEAGNMIYADSQNSSTEPAGEKKPAHSGIINPVPASDPVSVTYLGKCAFVGDSITAGFADYQYISSKNVIAEVGLNIDKINTSTLHYGAKDMTALEALSEVKPENIYILLGSNGIEWLTDSEMIGYYSEFVESVKSGFPDSKIFVLSIPPVTAERETASQNPIQNADIDKFNSSLLDMANEKGLYYVDINTILKGNDGKFPKENAADDGMHFNKDTYQIVIDYILSHTAE